MSYSIQPAIFIKSIHPSWIKFFKEMYWLGYLDAFLGKGYASFQLTPEERKKWNLTQSQETRIKEILQSNIDKIDSQKKKIDFLNILSSIDYIYIPNNIFGYPLIEEIHQESEETNQILLEQIESFIAPIISGDYPKLAKLLQEWPGKDIRTVFYHASYLITQKLLERNFLISFETFDNVISKNNLSNHVLAFYLLICFYFDKEPDTLRIDIFKNHLMKRNEFVNSTISGIIYRSWKLFPVEMYEMTKNWIDSKNTVLIYSLIHGVENPGRFDSLKALNFLHSVFFIEDPDVSSILSHVCASILCSDPIQTFHILTGFVNSNESNKKILQCIDRSLSDIIIDKFKNNNQDEFDFPNLEEILVENLKVWNANENILLQNLASNILNKISSSL
jgi:hypothetical protein